MKEFWKWVEIFIKLWQKNSVAYLLSDGVYILLTSAINLLNESSWGGILDD